MAEVRGECALCREKKELQLSHIIPKFVGRYLKQTSIGNIRSQENPDKPVQDIEKHYLLCHDCEERFSAAERYFANTVFYPYHKDNQEKIDYNEQLYYFITSLSWRSLYLDIVNFVKDGDVRIDVLEKMIESEKIMREFLLKRRSDIGNIENHIFFFERIQEVNAPADSIYHTGKPHVTIHRSLASYSGYYDNTIYTISNLMGIIIVTLYEKDADEEWNGTEIFNKDSSVVAKNQVMKSRVCAEIEFWMKQSQESYEKMSESNKQKIADKMKKLGEDIKKYDIFQDFMDDYDLKNIENETVKDDEV